jgi:DNA-binding MarR family transcriptional regulator
MRVFSFGYQRQSEKMKNPAPLRPETAGWTFFTNHAHVLLCLAADPEMRLRDVVARVGITERAVQKIISELESGGVLERQRLGRRNVYKILGKLPLRHSVEAHCTVEELVRFVLDTTR